MRRQAWFPVGIALAGGMDGMGGAKVTLERVK